MKVTTYAPGCPLCAKELQAHALFYDLRWDGYVCSKHGDFKHIHPYGLVRMKPHLRRACRKWAVLPYRQATIAPGRTALYPSIRSVADEALKRPIIWSWGNL